MSETKREIEVRGPDVESAIEAGLAQLGIGRSDVIIEVVDEGSRGLLGIGSRDAVVRLTPLTVPAPKPAPAAVAAVPAEQVAPKTAVFSEQLTEEEQVATEILQSMLEKMDIQATITPRLSPPDDLTGRQVLVLDIQGENLAGLIGVRGETLNALQYVTRLMVGHRLHRRATFILDVQGYRQRREKALTRLAERMARKVSKRKRPISLEPMPPHERRIIHMTLRNDKYVYTQSVGEGKRRKVRIYPK